MGNEIDLHGMGLHEYRYFNKHDCKRIPHLAIQRVPGGWNYIYRNGRNLSTQFVPLSNEFKVMK